MFTDLLVLFWGIAIFFSFVGWGWGIDFLLRPEKSSCLGMKAALGLAFSAILGGLMNFFSIISPKAILVYIGLGVVLSLVFMIALRKDIGKKCADNFYNFKKDKLTVILVAGIVLLFIFQYATALFSGFNSGDDYQAYFVYPAKMIQTGAMGNDPFSDRRLTSSLGGQNFMDTFVLALFPHDYLHLIDRGTGWLILLVLIWGLARRHNLSPRISAVMVGALMLIVPPTYNITGLVTTVVLFLLLLELTFFGEKIVSDNWRRQAILFALVAAALCSLKSSIIAACVFYFIFYYALSLRESSAKEEKNLIIKSFILSVILIFIFLAPWMLSMYSSSGTLLYPIFGRGYHGSVYGDYAVPYSELTYVNFLNLLYQLANILFVVLFLIILFFWRSSPKDNSFPQRIRLKLILWAAVIGVAVCAFLTAGFGVFRFSYPFVLAAIIFSLIIFLEKKDFFHGYITVLKYDSVALIILSVIFGAGMFDLFANIKSNLNLFYARLASRQDSTFGDFLSDAKTGAGFVSSPQEKIAYEALQTSLPEGAVFLARLNKPFLLDFKRNTVYIVDGPGGSSLPPGMPFFEGSEALSAYLLSKNIRYVAYSYATESNFTREMFDRNLKSTMNIWLRTAAKDTFDFQDNLKELGATRKKLFDDGQNFVLDLSLKAK